MNMPESIRSVLEGRPRRRPIGVHMPVERGQVRRIPPPSADAIPEIEAPERMVLVLRVDSQREFAEVMLVHPHVELATSLDLIVSPARSTIPYTVVVQTDTRSVVWTDQLEALIGEFDPEALEALGDVSVGRAVYRTNLSSGTPLRGPLDPRWDFKAQEGVAVRCLAADCTSALLSDEPFLQQLAECDDVKLRIRSLLNIQYHDIDLTMDDVEKLENWGVLKRSNWTDNLGRLSLEAFDSFWLSVDRALTTLHLPPNLTDDVSIRLVSM